MTRAYATRMIERLYSALAYTSAVAILAIGGALLALAAQREIVCATWQIVLGFMLVPLLAAAAWSCGNYRENARVRAVTGVLFVPLGLVNPLMWLCALIILRRRPVAAPARPQPRAIRPRPMLPFRRVHPVRQPVRLRIKDRDW
jgi:hypothetical protein